MVRPGPDRTPVPLGVRGDDPLAPGSRRDPAGLEVWGALRSKRDQAFEPKPGLPTRSPGEATDQGKRGDRTGKLISLIGNVT